MDDLELSQLCWQAVDAYEQYSYMKTSIELELRKRYPDLNANQLNRKRKQLGEQYFKDELGIED